MALAASDVGAEFKSQLQFTNVDLEKCLGDIFQFRRIDGRGDMAVAIDATGTSVLAMTRTLNGTANLNGRDGSLVGWNVEQLLRPWSAGRCPERAIRNGRTPFEKPGRLQDRRRHRIVDSVVLEGSKVRLGLAGSASIPARGFVGSHGWPLARRGTTEHGATMSWFFFFLLTTYCLLGRADGRAAGAM